MGGSVAIGLLSGAIALLAAAIAWGQWYTAREKLVVDVFDKRFAVYSRASAAIQPIIRKGGASEADMRAFMEAMLQARFLFGDDVFRYLDQILDAVMDLAAATEEMAGVQEPVDRELSIKKKWDALKKIADFSTDFHPLVTPYMKMQNRRPRTFAQWLREANAARIDAADGEG